MTTYTYCTATMNYIKALQGDKERQYNSRTSAEQGQLYASWQVNQSKQNCNLILI